MTKKKGTFEFRAGPPKASRGATLNELRKLVHEGTKIEGYKNISIQPLVWKVYTAGDENLYVKGSDAFDKFMAHLGVEGG